MACKQFIMALSLSSFCHGIEAHSLVPSHLPERNIIDNQEITYGHPLDQLPCEVWGNIFLYLPLREQTSLAATHPFFRDDFFWQPHFKLNYEGCNLPNSDLKSLYRLVLFLTKIDQQVQNPLLITVMPSQYDWILKATFTDPIVAKLKRYLHKMQNPNLKEQFFEEIEEGSRKLERIRKIWQWQYYKTFRHEGGQADLEEFYKRTIWDLPDHKARAYLEALIDKGNRKAQKSLSLAASWLRCGFTEKTAKEYLEHRSAGGDRHAQKQLNKAANGQYWWPSFRDERGRLYLEQRIAQGDQHAQKMLIEAAFYLKLDFNRETARAYLEQEAAAGNQQAQVRLNDAVECYQSDAQLSFGLSRSARRKYFEERVAKGDEDAKKRLEKLLLLWNLDLSDQTVRDQIEEQALKGDLLAEEAVEWIIAGFFRGEYGLNIDNLRSYLERLAEKGHKYSKERLLRSAFFAAIEKDYIWVNFTRQSGMAYIREHTKLWEADALKWYHCSVEVFYRQEKEDVLVPSDPIGTLRKAKIAGITAQKNMLDFMLEYDPKQAITLRWFFMFYNTLLVRLDPFSNGSQIGSHS
ncbi:hypothetical protein [Candidatus Odyssella thessalonicensis]|uniref:hypothetical protein n=1 Tax=Candidatus Odyssella thessalonicensis TaxID=84647 RepID=UPI000225C122|nr:hypothetical protein [Candidatus Odyssella thessalonicensis]